MERKEGKAKGILERPVTRRQAIKAGGIAAVGLAFSKPLIDTMYPKPAFAQYAVTINSCTPGFWKTHSESFWPIPKATTLGSIFNFGAPVDSSVQALSGDSFQTALQYKGGSSLAAKAQILLRAAAAAYLNSLKFPTYPISPSGVISQVNTALASNDGDSIIALATSLDDTNNSGECSFLIHGPATP